MRIFRAPEFRIVNCQPRSTIRQRIFFSIEKHLSVLYAVRPDFRSGTVSADTEFPDVLFRYRLQPYRLPDTGARCVPHSPALSALFAPRIFHGEIIAYLYFQRIFIPGQEVCDIRSEGQITVFMPADLPAVQQHFCFPADSPEVKKDVPPLPAFGDMQETSVKKNIFFFRKLFHA